MALLLFFLAGELTRGAPPPPVPQIPKMQVDCKGEPLPLCPAGWTGRICDLPCAGGDVCDYALYCHSHGDVYGLSTFGAYLFGMQPDWPDWLIHGLLRLFIVHHPAGLGLTPGISVKDLGLHPAAAFRSGAGGLTLFRFDQKYRGLPLFGPDEVVTLVANNVGAVSARGAIVDAREDYAHVLLPASQVAGEASILSHASTWSGEPVSALDVRDLRLVAFTRARARMGGGGRGRAPQPRRHGRGLLVTKIRPTNRVRSRRPGRRSRRSGT